jgi:serine/threonine protein kinase
MVYGYAHLEHFEYLAIDLLGKSLADDNDKFVRKFSIQEIANIGIQMVRCFFFHDRCYFLRKYVMKLSVLEHIHSHDIVHRDIKPQNVLAREGADFSHLYLIDFGLARRRLSGTPREVDLVKERINVFGTLSWASLNALNEIGELVFWATASIL